MVIRIREIQIVSEVRVMVIRIWPLIHKAFTEITKVGFRLIYLIVKLRGILNAKSKLLVLKSTPPPPPLPYLPTFWDNFTVNVLQACIKCVGCYISKLLSWPT